MPQRAISSYDVEQTTAILALAGTGHKPETLLQEKHNPEKNENCFVFVFPLFFLLSFFPQFFPGFYIQKEPQFSAVPDLKLSGRISYSKKARNRIA